MDEELEEMRLLREAVKRREAIAQRKAVGFKFEFKSSKNPAKVAELKGLRHQVVEQNEEEPPEEQDMRVVMGFATFGPQKRKGNSATSTQSTPSTVTSSKDL